MSDSDKKSTNTPSHSAAWHVLGAGAIGGLWALRLATVGTPVTLLAHNDPASSRTLTLHDGERIFTHIFPQSALNKTGPITRLLIATKANITASALAPLLPQLAPATPVLLLQNGMGVDEWLLTKRPDLCVLTGISTDGIYRRERNLLVQAGHGETMVGASREKDQKRALEISTELEASGWPVQAVRDIRFRRWQKLAINCAINPLTARYRCRNGELLTNPEALTTMRTVCAETALVMQAENIPATAEDLFVEACRIAEKTAGNTSSMLADAEAGRETEIRFLNGYLLQRAHAHGIALPVNTSLVQEILALPIRRKALPWPQQSLESPHFQVSDTKVSVRFCRKQNRTGNR